MQWPGLVHKRAPLLTPQCPRAAKIVDGKKWNACPVNWQNVSKFNTACRTFHLAPHPYSPVRTSTPRLSFHRSFLISSTYLQLSIEISKKNNTNMSRNPLGRGQAPPSGESQYPQPGADSYPRQGAQTNNSFQRAPYSYCSADNNWNASFGNATTQDRGVVPSMEEPRYPSFGADSHPRQLAQPINSFLGAPYNYNSANNNASFGNPKNQAQRGAPPMQESEYPLHGAGSYPSHLTQASNSFQRTSHGYSSADTNATFGNAPNQAPGTYIGTSRGNRTR